MLSRSSGLNFVFDKDVRTDTKTSVFLKDSTIESAVKLLLLTNQLDFRLSGRPNAAVYPNTAAKQKDYQSARRPQLLSLRTPTRRVPRTLRSRRF